MHKYTVETIYNFTCSVCKNWWSYASGQKGLPTYIQQNFACPHCGHRDSIGYGPPVTATLTSSQLHQEPYSPG